MKRTPAGSGRILALFLSPGRGQAMQSCPEVQAQKEHGLEGDAHARPGGSRQVLLLDAETLQEFGLEPGVLKENITTQGVRLEQIPPGSRLRAGQALLEITKDCAPCGFVDAVQSGLQQRIGGRRGQLARVVEGGRIGVGDPIQVLTEDRLSPRGSRTPGP